MKTKPPLKLVGEDGNAVFILVRAVRAAKDVGWTREQIDSYRAKATAGDYDNLLRVTMEQFDCDSGDGDEEDDE